MAEWEFNHSIINGSGVGPAIHDTLLYGFMNLKHPNEKVVDIFFSCAALFLNWGVRVEGAGVAGKL